MVVINDFRFVFPFFSTQHTKLDNFTSSYRIMIRYNDTKHIINIKGNYVPGYAVE